MKPSNLTVLSQKEQERLQWITFVIAILFAAVFAILRLKGIIPGPGKVILFLQSLYADYGYLVVFVSAVLEGLIGLNFYFPGSTAILLGVIFAQRSNLSIPAVVLLTIIGFTISYTANYFIGKHGVHKLSQKLGYGETITKQGTKLAKNGWWTIFSCYFHPNLAAIISTGAGLIKMPFWKFTLISTLSLIFWDSLWAILASRFGESIIKATESPYAGFIILAWTFLALYISYKQVAK